MNHHIKEDRYHVSCIMYHSFFHEKRYAARRSDAAIDSIRALANFLEAIFNFPRVVICKEEERGKGKKD